MSAHGNSGARPLALSARARYLAGLLAVLLGAGILAAPPSSAFLFVVPAPSFPDTVVGQTAPAALGINNSSTPPESTTNPVLTISQIDLYPSCTNSAVDCTGGTAEPGVYAVSATGTGSSIPPGNATCTGTWTIVPNTGNVATATRYRFIPPGGEGSLLLATGETCVVNFTITTRRVPTNDVSASPGVQTNHVASSTATGPTLPGTRNTGGDQSTVAAATPGLATQASSTPPQVPAGTPPRIPATASDTATLSPPPPPSSANGVPPTGTITFNLYGPANPTCAGAPVFTNTVPVNNGFNDYTTSTPANITAPGTYIWVATYSGDVNYLGSATACGDPDETLVFAQAAPTIVTTASGTTIGQPISDSATLSGGFNPTGTITFSAYGPNNATCTGAPFFTSTVPVAGNGTYGSGNSTNVTQAGVYRWTATYSGDANNASATSACNAAGESTQVGPATPTLVTTATATAPVGQPISDSATLSGGINPTGTITFTLFGPNNATCTGAPVFTSAPVAVNGNGAYPSPNFTPTQVGTYRWIASYSGDANNNAVTTLCNDPAEASVVTQLSPTLVTNATATAPVGSPIGDTATLANGFNPTGTITFTLFGPNNATCTGAPIFTSAPVTVNGNGAYPSPTFTPSAPGTYRWIASYSGDANNAALTTACNDPNEATVVTQAQPAIATTAMAAGTVGSPITDTATLSNGVSPTGTITFSLYGPNNPTCTGPAIFVSIVNVTNGNGQYTSGGYSPTAPGSYNWVAVYSGDANNAGATSPCGAAGETTPVAPAQPALVTQAAGPVTLSQSISDTATLSGGVATPPAAGPTGTITFTLFGPNNPTCTGAPIFTSAVPVNGNGQYPSGPFTPATPGTYNWVAVYSGDANNATITSACGAANESSTVTALPTIQVDKTANPTSLPEPGGNFTYTVVVTNTSSQNLTLTTLTDDKYGNLVTRAGSTCNTLPGTVLIPGGTYTCSFTAPFNGNANASLTDIVTVNATNPNGVTVTDTDDATVTLSPVPPTVSVDKTASPLSRPEPGGSFTFTVVVTNTSAAETVTITSLNDNVYGNIATLAGSTCGTLIGTTLAPGASSAPCTFTGTFTGNAGASQTDIVTVLVTDDDGQTATDTDDAIVTITNVLPTITVVKTANPLTRPEPGGSFNFTVVVTNTSAEPVTITGLTDNIYGNLAGKGNCALGAVLQPNGTYTCTFPGTFTGNAGASQTDVVTATAVDDDGSTATAMDDATVSLLNVVPSILVTKDATPASRPEPGGSFTFNVVVTNNGSEAITVTGLTDDIYGNLNGKGTCATGAVLQPGGSYSCSFTGNFTGQGGASQTDIVTATGVDDDNTTVTDTDDATVTITDVPPTVTVLKTPQPASRPEPGGDFTYTVVVTNTSAEPVTITALTDNVYGNLTTRTQSNCNTAIGTVLQPNASYTCQFVAPFTGMGGASLTDIVTTSVVDNEGTTATATDDATVTLTALPPTIDVTKAASPASRPEPGGSFTFNVVVTNTHINPMRITALTDNIYGNLATKGTCTTAIGTILQPGGTYSCSFTGTFTGNAGASQTDIVTVTAVSPTGATATDTATATVTITDVPPTVDLTKTASPTSRPEPGGTFDFTVVVTNTSGEPVTITSLVDDVYGNLNGKGTCAIGTVLQPSASYTCKFSGTFTGDGGAKQTDTITVVVTDDDHTTATDIASATVTITDVPPTITVTKTATPSSRPSPGGAFTFTVGITNTSAEAVTVTAIVDDVYGNLDGKGTCKIGTVLQPGETYTCAFDGNFSGNSGASQTDTVTGTVKDNEGTTATNTAKATVSLTLPVVPVQTPLPRTGGNMTGPIRLASGLVVAGLLLVAITWRSQRMTIAGGAVLWWPWRGPEPPDGDTPSWFGFGGGSPRTPTTGMGLGLPRDTSPSTGGPSRGAAGVSTFGAPLD